MARTADTERKAVLNTAEFDRFADEYAAMQGKIVKISGEQPEYFARYKIDAVRRVWSRQGRPEPRAVLDFGAGIGNSLPHLHSRFPTAEITALDVSARSLQVARHRFGDIARYQVYDGAGPLAADGSIDLAFTSCVFHHIDEHEHVDIMRRLRRTLAPGGALVVFENNPINPVTQYIVATCPFDENAVLLSSGLLRRRLREAGFQRADVGYTGFFPAALSALRGMEPYLANLPLGAQYYVLAEG